MTSLKVTWTLLHVPRTTVVKDDNCAMGPESKVNQNFRSQELEKKVKCTVNSQVPKTRKPEMPKPRNLYHSWRQLCYGPKEKKKGWKFRSQELEREASVRTSKGRNPQNRNPKILKS
jgi:hypothetical protein